MPFKWQRRADGDQNMTLKKNRIIFQVCLSGHLNSSLENGTPNKQANKQIQISMIDLCIFLSMICSEVKTYCY
jgi:hypothetical protein